MFATLTSGPIFFQLIVYTASIALNLLRFERVSFWTLWEISSIYSAFSNVVQTFNELNFSAIPNLNTLLIQILFNYVICSYASNVSAKLSSVSDIVYNSFWYKYPAELQKLLPLLTQRSQTPYIITGYGIINCSLDTFLLVCSIRTISCSAYWKCSINLIWFHSMFIIYVAYSISDVIFCGIQEFYALNLEQFS